MFSLKAPNADFFIDTTKCLKILTIPCLKDNYTYLALSPTENEAVLFDCADYQKTLKILKDLKLKLNSIFITHHHPDHIDGIDKITAKHPEAKLYCSLTDQKRRLFKSPSTSLTGEESLTIFNEQIEVMSTPGHTKSLLSFYLKKSGALFCGDHIFSLGCGRVFEPYSRVYSDFFESIQKIAKLPKDTLLFCAHEYTSANLNFHEKNGLLKENTVEALKTRITDFGNMRSIPSTLSFETEHNAFFRAETSKKFEHLRGLKDSF